MKHEKHQNPTLRNTSKNSLLLASRFGIPLGYALVGLAIALNISAFMHPGLEQPPFPLTVLIPLGLVVVLVVLVFSHRAVRRELRNRQEETSYPRRTLLRVTLFVGVGLLFWLALFFATLCGLERLTSISSMHALEISAVLPIPPMVLGGLMLARKETASCCRSGRSADARDS